VQVTQEREALGAAGVAGIPVPTPRAAGATGWAGLPTAPPRFLELYFRLSSSLPGFKEGQLSVYDCSSLCLPISNKHPQMDTWDNI